MAVAAWAATTRLWCWPLPRSLAGVVLWLCGPPGVGKSTVGWVLYRGLSGAAFVDIDQLGMCFPESPDDPGRHRLKARNLGAVLANFQDAGACQVVVSGVVDAMRAVHREEIPPEAVRLCRLTASRQELERRLAGRGAPAEVVEEALREADILDASDVGDVVVDTTGRSVGEVARRVRALCRPTRPIPPPQGPPAGDGPILWLTGPAGVGKSTVGFRVYQKILGRGRTAAFVDARQLGFHDSAGVVARNLAALWHNFRVAGAGTVVVVGPVAALEACAAELDISSLRLHAGAGALTERIMARGRGEGWAEPGDPLAGQGPEQLRRVIDQAVAEAESAAHGPSLDTDGLTVDEIADAVLARWDSVRHEQVCFRNTRKHRPLRGRSA
jgi:adenylylsulfate kinase-like enzyme